MEPARPEYRFEGVTLYTPAPVIVTGAHDRFMDEFSFQPGRSVLSEYEKGSLNSFIATALSRRAPGRADADILVFSTKKMPDHASLCLAL